MIKKDDEVIVPLELRKKNHLVTMAEYQTLQLEKKGWSPINLYPEICWKDRMVGVVERLAESGLVSACTIFDTSFGGYLATQLSKGINRNFVSGYHLYDPEKPPIPEPLEVPVKLSLILKEPRAVREAVLKNLTNSENPLHSKGNDPSPWRVHIPVQTYDNQSQINPSELSGGVVLASSELFSPELLLDFMAQLCTAPRVVLAKLKKEYLGKSGEDLSSLQGLCLQGDSGETKGGEGTSGVTFIPYYFSQNAEESVKGPSDKKSALVYCDSLYVALVRSDVHEDFLQMVGTRVNGRELFLDNLVNIVIMVKNAGEGWEDVLASNLPFVDRFTVVDTGSTDDTVATACRVLGESGIPWNVHGGVPFVDFSTTRNLSLDLAGSSCEFNIMLDDTYVVGGDLRRFLFNVRADSFADSMSLYITDSCMTYSSNRLTRPQLMRLRYINTIHEVIEKNENVCIPVDRAHISDRISPDMVVRTSDRKKSDLALLEKELEAKPGCSRSVYYIAETYFYMGEYEMALEYYTRRANMVGGEQYEQERYDAQYKATVVGHTYCKKPWNWTLFNLTSTYISCVERVDPLYLIICYLLEKATGAKSEDAPYDQSCPAVTKLRRAGYLKLALMYSKEAMTIKFNSLTQHISLRKYLYYVAIPRCVMNVAQLTFSGKLAQKAAQRIWDYYGTNPDTHLDPYPAHLAKVEASHFYMAGGLLEKKRHIEKELKSLKKKEEKDSFNADMSQKLTNILKTKSETFTNGCIMFVAPDGWESWDGEVLRTTGLGGSESCIVNYSEELAKTYNVSVLVFCKRDSPSLLRPDEPLPLAVNVSGVTYISVDLLPLFLSSGGSLSKSERVITACIVSRSCNYLPLIHSQEKILRVHLLLHDIVQQGTQIYGEEKLKRVLCLSDWHKQQVSSIFPSLGNKLRKLTYGINTDVYKGSERLCGTLPAWMPGAPLRFIYPSFPNRGLVYLLRLFPRIVKAYPYSRLDIFVRFDLPYVKEALAEHWDEIQLLLAEQRQTVTNHGWVAPGKLCEFWKQAHIWLYPCVFSETFCKVAQEAAASHTLAIAPPLAALQTSIGDRGILINGDASTAEWAEDAVETVLSIIASGGEEFSDPTTGYVKEVSTLLDRNFDWAKSCETSSVVRSLIN
jgi:glycosyltransferase involved in cell wall biosynthesis